MGCWTPNLHHIFLNSLAPGKFEWNFRYLIFQIISVIVGRVISCELALRWMSLGLTDDKSTLVLVMAWCHQATSHYLSQCWPRSLSPYGVTRPQWFNGCNVILISQKNSYDTIINVKLAWWLLMPWCLFGTRASTTIMMTQALGNISGQTPSVYKAWKSGVWYKGCSSVMFWSWHVRLRHGLSFLSPSSKYSICYYHAMWDTILYGVMFYVDFTVLLYHWHN